MLRYLSQNSSVQKNKKKRKRDADTNNVILITFLVLVSLVSH